MEKTQKINPFDPEIQLIVLSGVVLLLTYLIGRNISAVTDFCAIFGALWAFIAVVLLAIRTSGRREFLLKTFPIYPGRDVFAVLVVTVVFVFIFNYFFKNVGFAFEDFQKFNLPWYIGLPLLAIFVSFIEESFLAIIQATIMRVFGKKISLQAVMASLLTVSVLFILGHVYLGSIVTSDFLVAAFVFRMIVGVLNLRFGTYAPGFLGHSFINGLKAAAIYALPWYAGVALPGLVAAWFLLNSSQRQQ